MASLFGKDVIGKIWRGLYDRPLFSTYLQEYQALQIEKVAHALARNYGWNMVAIGDTALNLLGLSSQGTAN